jgi:hypothetical protein
MAWTGIAARAIRLRNLIAAAIVGDNSTTGFTAPATPHSNHDGKINAADDSGLAAWSLTQLGFAAAAPSHGIPS